MRWRESLLEMNRSRPGFRRSLLGEMFITLYYPSASQELIDWHNENFRKLGPAKNMEPVIDLVSRIDVRDELAKIRAPTLVFHCRSRRQRAARGGRQVAEGIAGARFVELDSANHIRARRRAGVAGLHPRDAGVFGAIRECRHGSESRDVDSVGCAAGRPAIALSTRCSVPLRARLATLGAL